MRFFLYVSLWCSALITVQAAIRLFEATKSTGTHEELRRAEFGGAFWAGITILIWMHIRGRI